jgi:hypothetical protein
MSALAEGRQKKLRIRSRVRGVHPTLLVLRETFETPMTFHAGSLSDQLAPLRAAALSDLVTVVTDEELAVALRFEPGSGRFREWLKLMSIKPLPGRRGVYDLRHVRHRLDVMQGMADAKTSAMPAAELSPLEKRKLRRAQAS